jgi:hypothetical protein
MVNPVIQTLPTDQSSGEIVTQLSKSYLDANLDKTGKVLEAVGVTSYLEDQGITSGVDKEGVKSILASMSAFYLLYQAKKNWKIVVPAMGIIGLMLYLSKRPKKPSLITKKENATSSTVFGIRG